MFKSLSSYDEYDTIKITFNFFESYGRFNMGEVVRQGFLTKKTYMYVGRKVTLKKWKPKWVVLTRRGIFFFDYRCVEVYNLINFNTKFIGR